MQDQTPLTVGYILNLFETVVSLPYEIIPGFTIRKVTDRERELVSREMHRAGYGFNSHAAPYEMKISFNRGVGKSWEVNPKNWRYLVIEFPALENDRFHTTKDPRRKMSRFKPAALISNAHLLWGMESMADPESENSFMWSHHPDILHSFDWYLETTLLRQKRLSVLNAGDIEDIRVLFSKLESLHEEQKLIIDACERYRASYGLSMHSSFRTLALFSTIELLVTHKPSANESGDSLTRQIKTKLPLLCRRFTAPYHPEPHFPDAGEKVWGMLYGYRSAIAHGTSIDFKNTFKKDGFKELKSALDVFFYLDEFVRRLLRQAVLEPQLYLDLKEC